MNIRKRNKYKAIKFIRNYKRRQITDTFYIAYNGFKIACNSFNNALSKTADNLIKTFRGMKLN